MNDSQRESSVLAEQLKKTIQKRTGYKFEIRAVAGSEGRAIAERLLTSLRLGGLDAEVIEVTSSPRNDILIETAHEAAGVALALQSAFLAAQTPVQLLVQNKPKPRVIVLHLGTTGS